MKGPRHVAGLAAAVLLALAAWCSWQMCGLSGDGAYFLVDILHHRGFTDDPATSARFLANGITQLPVVLAVHLGVTDVRGLARLYSLGLYALPAGLYALAVVRAARDEVVLALVLAGLAAVFLPTAFAIVGEYNAAYAIAVTAAVWIATAERLVVRDGLVLLALAIVALRSYECFVYLGPALALLSIAAIRRAPDRPAAATSLHIAAAVTFILAGFLSLHALVTFEDAPYRAAAIRDSLGFWRNLAFDLALLAMTVIAGWALLRPEGLAERRVYRVATIVAIALAVSPVLAAYNLLPRLRFTYLPDDARLAAGVVVLGGILLLWRRRVAPKGPPRALAVLGTPAAALRLRRFAALLFAASVPWFLTSAALFVNYLSEVEQALRGRTGVIAYEDVPLSPRSRLSQNDAWQLTYLSLLLRAAPGDATIAPARSWQEALPEIGTPALEGYAWSR